MRKTARSVVLNKKDEIALLFVSKNNYHKLPGGGADSGESVLEALDRKVMEEIAPKIEVLSKVGLTVEYRDQNRDQMEKLQISYCLLSKLINSNFKISFTKSEKAQGFEIKWIHKDLAINLLKNGSPIDYQGKFIQRRDVRFLEKALNF